MIEIFKKLRLSILGTTISQTTFVVYQEGRKVFNPPHFFLSPTLPTSLSFSFLESQSRESLLNGKALVQFDLLEVQINYFSNWNYIFLFYKTTYLNEEVNCTGPSLTVRVPWPIHFLFICQVGMSEKMSRRVKKEKKKTQVWLKISVLTKVHFNFLNFENLTF